MSRLGSGENEMSRRWRPGHTGTRFFFPSVTADAGSNNLDDTRRHLRLVMEPHLIMFWVIPLWLLTHVKAWSP